MSQERIPMAALETETCRGCQGGGLEPCGEHACHYCDGTGEFTIGLAAHYKQEVKVLEYNYMHLMDRRDKRITTLDADLGKMKDAAYKWESATIKAKASKATLEAALREIKTMLGKLAMDDATANMACRVIDRALAQASDGEVREVDP